MRLSGDNDIGRQKSEKSWKPNNLSCRAAISSGGQQHDESCEPKQYNYRAAVLTGDKNLEESWIQKKYHIGQRHRTTSSGGQQCAESCERNSEIIGRQRYRATKK